MILLSNIGKAYYKKGYIKGKKETQDRCIEEIGKIEVVPNEYAGNKKNFDRYNPRHWYQFVNDIKVKLIKQIKEDK